MIQKCLIFCIIVVVNYIAIFAADSTKVAKNIKYEDENIILELTTHLYVPNNILPFEMRGKVFTNLIISENGEILHFAIIRFEITDSSQDNVIRYYDKKAFDLMPEERIKALTEDYYPTYIRDLYRVIRASINNIKIRKKSSAKLNKWNNFMATFFINQ